jgi:hypothetical protein
MKHTRNASSLAAALLLLYFAVGVMPALGAAENCEYRVVSIDPTIADAGARGREIAEPMRRAFLQLATDALTRIGLRVAQDPKDAYWTLTASSLVGPTSVGIFIELTGSVELQHHLYIAELDRNGFPYRGWVGGNHYIDVLAGTRPERYRAEVEAAVRLLWGYEAQQVSALCAMSAQLQDEGWVGIEELRAELIEEMRRARRERATQSRQLELNVEDPPPTGSEE